MGTKYTKQTQHRKKNAEIEKIVKHKVTPILIKKEPAAYAYAYKTVQKMIESQVKELGKAQVCYTCAIQVTIEGRKKRHPNKQDHLYLLMDLRAMGKGTQTSLIRYEEDKPKEPSTSRSKFDFWNREKYINRRVIKIDHQTGQIKTGQIITTAFSILTREVMHYVRLEEQYDEISQEEKEITAEEEIKREDCEEWTTEQVEEGIEQYTEKYPTISHMKDTEPQTPQKTQTLKRSPDKTHTARPQRVPTQEEKLIHTIRTEQLTTWALLPFLQIIFKEEIMRHKDHPK